MNAADVAANARLLRYFAGRSRQYDYRGPDEIHGTHPDLIMRLWTDLGEVLPEDCHAVVYGSPALVRRSSGIIFGFAGGTHTYAMRLPAEVRAAAIKAGATRVHHYRAHPELKIQASTFDLDNIGEAWVFGQWLEDEPQWIKVAYDFATEP